MRRKKCKPNYRRTVLRLPDLDHSGLAVLNSLTSQHVCHRLNAGEPVVLRGQPLGTWTAISVPKLACLK